MTLTDIPALMRDRATSVWPFLAARWRGENLPRDRDSSSGQWEMRRWTCRGGERNQLTHMY